MPHLICLVLLAGLAAGACAQSPPPPPPPADTDWSRTEGPTYISFSCAEGFVYFESDGELHGTQRFWLDDEDEVRVATYSETDSAYVAGPYRADWGRRTFVERDGVAIRTDCVQDRGEAAARAVGRPGLRIAWARMNPKPLTTRLAPPGRNRPLWVGHDILVLDATTVRAARVERELGDEFGLVGLDLTPAAAAAFKQATRDHLRQPLAVLHDGVLVAAPQVQAIIPGPTVALPLSRTAADELTALLPDQP